MKTAFIGALALGLWLGAPLLAQSQSAAPEKIVSLGGSITEIAVALGAEDRLIGRDSTSLYPPSVLALPDVGYIRAISPEGVLSLAPDLILAEGDAGPPAAVEVLKSAGIPFALMPHSPRPEDIPAKIRAVGEALQLAPAAEALAQALAADLAKAKSRAEALAEKKRVLFILSLQNGSVMVGGQETSAEGIITLAGGINAAEGVEGYKPLTDEAILQAAPDVLLMMDRSGDLAVLDEAIFAHPALSQTPAAQAGAILRMDGLLLLGFGPRTPEAADQLYTALYGAVQ